MFLFFYIFLFILYFRTKSVHKLFMLLNFDDTEFMQPELDLWPFVCTFIIIIFFFTYVFS